jgi:hypothetical protein
MGASDAGRLFFDVKCHRLLSRHSAKLDSWPPDLRDHAEIPSPVPAKTLASAANWPSWPNRSPFSIASWTEKFTEAVRVLDRIIAA